MKNVKYESPEIQVICIEPDKTIMTGSESGMGTSIPTFGVGPMCPDENT